jgi:predicted transcriptional regulator of viral defense system
MARTRLQIAKADIFSYFDALPSKVLRRSDVARILTQQRGFWRLALSTRITGFVDFLEKSGKLRRLDFAFPVRPTHCYIWGDVPLLEVLLHLKPRSYLSHYTAMRYHGLTEQVPRTIYVTHEQVHPNTRAREPLSQELITAAFKNPVRESQNIASFGSRTICLINGADTQMQGITSGSMADGTDLPAMVKVTDLERTLIDATVRPVYSGGVAEVMKAFREAREALSVNRLRGLLHRLAYLYPFHQAIGFYLERADYPESSLKLIRELPQIVDFYLAHAMSEADYVPQWRLFVPKGL